MQAYVGDPSPKWREKLKKHLTCCRLSFQVLCSGGIAERAFVALLGWMLLLCSVHPLPQHSWGCPARSCQGLLDPLAPSAPSSQPCCRPSPALADPPALTAIPAKCPRPLQSGSQRVVRKGKRHQGHNYRGVEHRGSQLHEFLGPSPCRAYMPAAMSLFSFLSARGIALENVLKLCRRCEISIF